MCVITHLMRPLPDKILFWRVRVIKAIMIEILGWFSSLILLATLVKQVWKQWKDKTSEGISKWLFAGQLIASIGFTIYSIATKSWVFAFTNAALTVNNLIGVTLYFYYRK